MKRVILYIDRLVLKGFWHEDWHDHSEDLREALTRAFAGPDAKPSGIGAQAARNIIREIKS